MNNKSDGSSLIGIVNAAKWHIFLFSIYLVVLVMLRELHWLMVLVGATVFAAMMFRFEARRMGKMHVSWAVWIPAYLGLVVGLPIVFFAFLYPDPSGSEIVSIVIPSYALFLGYEWLVSSGAIS
ncbi:MAG: hypothetical protein GXP16_01765 [Gammaproteobacteria bacterium]|nr:hypothetical protein [Gammaproteobacteria bacterium]